MLDCYHCYSTDTEAFFGIKPGFVAHALQTGKSAEGEHGEIYFQDYIMHPNSKVLRNVVGKLIHNQMQYRRKIEREMTKKNAERGFNIAETATIIGIC